MHHPLLFEQEMTEKIVFFLQMTQKNQLLFAQNPKANEIQSSSFFSWRTDLHKEKARLKHIFLFASPPLYANFPSFILVISYTNCKIMKSQKNELNPGICFTLWKE